MKKSFATQFPNLYYWYLTTRWFIEDIPENLLIRSRLRLTLYLIMLTGWILSFLIYITFPIIKLSLEQKTILAPFAQNAFKFVLMQEITSIFCHSVPLIGTFLLLESLLYRIIRASEPIYRISLRDALKRTSPYKIHLKYLSQNSEGKPGIYLFAELGEMNRVKKGNILNIFILSLTLTLLSLTLNWATL